MGQDDVQVSLSGREVGFGFVESAELVGRINVATTLIGRIAERLRKLPFAEQGLRKATETDFPVLVSAPRSSSFAVTLRVGRQTIQPRLPVETEKIIDELMDLMELVHEADNKTLEKRIPEPPYLRNFLGLARKIAPHGERVRQVGFTVQRGDQARRLSVTRPASEIQFHTEFDTATEADEAEKQVEVRGTLLFADATGGEANVIKIVDRDGKPHSVSVPEGMMNDIVRPMWNSKVVVRGLQNGRRVSLRDVEPDE